MDNLKYYNDSFAYDYDRFVTAEKPKKADILEYPETKKAVKEKKRAAVRKSNATVRKAAVILLVLSAICASLFLRAEITEMKTRLNGINKEITELESENTRLAVEIERRVSYVNLEKQAIELGMQKCEKSQVVYVKTNEDDTAENTKGLLTVDLE